MEPGCALQQVPHICILDTVKRARLGLIFSPLKSPWVEGLLLGI